MTNYQNPQPTHGSFLKLLSTFHLAMLAAPLIFTMMAVFLNSSGATSTQPSHNVFLYVVPGLAVAAFFVSRFLFNSLLQKAREKDSLKGKLLAYQVAFLMRGAILEGASLFASVTYLLTSPKSF